MTQNLGPKVYNKHHRNAPPGSVYIGRGSKWGNPYVIGSDGTREEVIQKYRDNMSLDLEMDAAVELRGKDLVCFCSPSPCHGDILLEIANPQ